MTNYEWDIDGMVEVDDGVEWDIGGVVERDTAAEEVAAYNTHAWFLGQSIGIGLRMPIVH